MSSHNKGKIQDLTDMVFGRLTVLRMKQMPTAQGLMKTYAIAKCECGNEHIATASNLKMGTTKSCGCHRSEMMRARRKPMTIP